MRAIYAIRVMSAFLATLVSTFFVKMYSAWRFKYEHRGENLSISATNEVLLRIGPSTALVPVVILLFGLYLVIRHPNRLVLIEVLVQASWVMAIGAALFAILSWQAQNVPWFDLRGAHF